MNLLITSNVRREIQERHLRSAIFVGPPPDDFKDNEIKYLGVQLINQAQAAAEFFRDTSA